MIATVMTASDENTLSAPDGAAAYEIQWRGACVATFFGPVEGGLSRSMVVVEIWSSTESSSSVAGCGSAVGAGVGCA